MALGQQRVHGQRVLPIARAQPVEPAVADGHMADLLAQNRVQNHDRSLRRRRTHTAQTGLDNRGGVEPPRLQGARHQSHTGQNIVTGVVADRPQAVVRAKITVGIAQGL